MPETIPNDQRRLRIAIFAETFPPSGGGISAAHYALFHLLKANHDIELFAFRDPRPTCETVTRMRPLKWIGVVFAWMARMRVRKYDKSSTAEFCQRIAQTIPAIWSLNKFLRRFTPDVIFVSDDSLPLLAMVKPKGAKVIWMAHHNYTRFSGNAMSGCSGWYDTFLAHRLELRAVKKADHVVFPCKYMERIFRETLHDNLPGTVIPNHVDLRPLNLPTRAAARHALGLQDSCVLVYIPSAGSRVKGERYVFEIIRRLSGNNPHVRFLLSGAVSEALEVELRSGILPAITIVPGNVELQQNLCNVAAADLLVSPAHLENFSCALLEALHLGIPCVTFNVGGNAELVADGVTGYVVPYLDMEALINSCLILIRDSGLRQTMRSAAFSRAVQLGNAEELRRKYEDVFLSLNRF